LADPVSLAINAALIAANMAITASQKFEGPRLDELNVTTADYGSALNYVYGKRRLDGVSCIWAEPLTEVKRRRKTKGGKFNEYTYYGTWAVAACDHEIAGYLRIWFDRNLVYDATGVGPVSPFTELGDITQFMTFYLGTADQDVDPRMAATVDAEHGAGSTPAYRNVAYITFKDLPLEKLGNRLPQVSVEVMTAGADTFPVDTCVSVDGWLINGHALTWSYAQDRLFYSQDGAYDIWDVNARAHMVGGQLQVPDGDAYNDGMIIVGITLDGSIYTVTMGGLVLRHSADGTSLENVLNPGDPLSFATHCMSVVQGAVDGDLTFANDVVFVFRARTLNGAWYSHNHSALLPVPGCDPDAGATWQPTFTFADLDGNVFLVGGGTSASVFAADECVLSRFPTGDITILQMPESGTEIAPSAYVFMNVGMYHYRDEALGLDQYIVGFIGNSLTYYLMIYDIASATFTTTITSVVLDPWYFFHEFQKVKPGARSIWVFDTEYSSVDLSVIRTYEITDYTPSLPGNLPVVYEPLLNALFVERLDGFQWLYLDRVDSEGVTLRSIVEDVSERCGLVVGTDIDATDLTQIVRGYSWTQGSAKAILEPLIEAYDSEARPHDFLIEYLRRGVAVGGAIPVADMGAGGGVRYEVATTLDTDLPLKVNLTFADLDKDQQPNTALAQRSGSATDSRRELSLDASTLALDADEARQMADGYLRRQWMDAQTIKLSVSRAYTALEAGDARTLELDDVSRVAKLVRLEFGANGVLTSEWKRYAVAVHSPTALAGADGDGLTPGEVTVFGYTKGLALDIPLVADTHDSTTPFLYLAASPYSDEFAWPGASFNRGDDGVTYDEEIGSVSSTERGTIGHMLSALPEALATVWDMGSVVSVKLFSGTLTSVTRAEAANGANAAAIRSGGGWEIVRFMTAALVAENTFQLSGFLRGRRGSEWAIAGHATGDAFVLLAGLPRAGMGADDVDEEVYVRPTTNGGPNGFPQLLEPYTGAALKPYAPCHLAITESAGDLVLTATRRTRIGGNWSDFQDVPLGESSEAYIGYALDAGGAVIRTFTGLTSPTFTYTAAQQATDGGLGVTLGLAQVSTVVGAGYRAELAIPA
jgi:hypothetical protein